MNKSINCAQTDLIDEILNCEDVISEYLTDERKRVVKYDTFMTKRKGDAPKTISFDEIDHYDFNKGFIEYLISEEYVHLYFDFDEIQSTNELEEVLVWLADLTDTFGEFTYGGYTNNEKVAEYGFRLYPEGNHFLSMHVIFPETRISTRDLQTIMKHDSKKGYLTQGIHPRCDPNVYKLVAKKPNETVRQLFRHVLSDKIFAPGSDQNKLNHGCLIDDESPSRHIIQIRGDEPIVAKSEWMNLFKVPDQREPPSTRISVEDTMYTDLNVRSSLITISDEDLEELLDEFPPSFDNLSKIISNIFHSPFTEEYALEVVNRWWCKADHTHDDTPERYSKYHERIESNKWFYSIINHLEPSKRSSWAKKFASVSVDEDVHIDFKDGFTLKNLRENDYSLTDGKRIDVNRFMNDLKKCVVVINEAKPLFIVKDYNGARDTMRLSFIDSGDFKTLMNSINVGSYRKNNKWKTATAYTIYNEGKNKNLLMRDGLRFYDTRENMFSYFTGYDYDVLDAVDESLIEPFLKHIKEVISNNDEAVYEYFINWISMIIQQPDGKTETAIVITGDQGTGKNVFTNVICDLMKRYSNRNLNNIDHLVGKFNTALENMKLIICNELSSADTNKYLNSDSLKSVITEREVTINPKGLAPRDVQNVVNLIMVSNNFAPVNIEGGDRRYVVTATSNAHKGDYDYFDSLCRSMDEAFYNNLLTFFMKRDLSKFNPRKIPMTEVKKAVQEISRSAYESFIQANLKQFVEGIGRKEAYETYKRWANESGFKQANISTFKSKIMAFTDDTKISREGKQIHVYRLKADMKSRFDEDDADDVSDVSEYLNESI